MTSSGKHLLVSGIPQLMNKSTSLSHLCQGHFNLSEGGENNWQCFSESFLNISIERNRERQVSARR